MATTSNCDLFFPQWKMDRCPHCRVKTPNLTRITQIIASTDDGKTHGAWGSFCCATCAAIVLVYQPVMPVHGRSFDVIRGMSPTIWPAGESLSSDIPVRARNFLSQAINSFAEPDASIMVAASSVDAMLKAISLTNGSLYDRIKLARERGLITSGMADWAHEVRLAANELRHADEEMELNTTEDARRLVEFAIALGEFLFVLPARVRRGLRQPTPGDEGQVQQG